jgi:Tol biopolymer transport system component
VFRNGYDGVAIHGATDDPACDSLRVVNNHAHHNGRDGIVVSDTTRDTVLVANRTERNGDDGIDVDGSFGEDLEPAWSPDGRRLAFRSDRLDGPGLYVVGVTGKGLRRLSDGGQPDWSPDGERIAFAAAGEVHVIASDGSGERLLAAGTEPQWSPDGTEILFQAGRELRIVDVGTGAVRVLASGSDAEWSPDGSRIAFSGIRTINRDGSANALVANGTAPSWSPDGKRIAFSDGYEIVTAAPDGSDLRYLMLDEPLDARPQWSPKGDLIAFYRADDPAGTYLVEPDGDGLRFVAAPGDGVWSPDGARLAFAGLDIKDVETGEWTTVGNDTNSLVSLARNHANANFDLGIEAGAGVTDGGGNRAAGNGDPAECAGVSCSPQLDRRARPGPPL